MIVCDRCPEKGMRQFTVRQGMTYDLCIECYDKLMRVIDKFMLEVKFSSKSS